MISGASVGVSSEVSDGDRLLADVEGSELTRYTSFGTSVVNAGDMDGDGEDEVLVGHPQVPLFQANGRLYRFSATDFADPAVSTADTDRYTGAEAGNGIGHTNVAVGDVNGDGYADILTRSGSHQMAGYASGTIFLFYGAVTLPADTSSDDADVRIGNDLSTATYSGDPLWADNVRGLGDINGDGADDLLIASSGADLSGSYANNGTASLFLGGTRSGDQGLLGSADVRFWGRQMYGVRPVLAPGDLDGDGLDDFFLGHNSSSDATLYFYSGARFP